jgi:hypothetical protein
MTTRKLLNTAALTGVAVAAFCAPTFANAQVDERNVSVRERQKPEYEPLGIRAGSFMVRPEITGEVEFNDNVLATPTNEQDDVIFRVMPSLQVRSDWSRNALGLKARLVNWSYQDFSNEDHTDWDVSGDFRLDVGARGSVTLNAGVGVDHDSRLNAASPAGSDDPVEFSTSTFGILAEQEFNRFKLSGSVDYDEYDYDDVSVLGVPIDQDYRDFQQTEYTVRGDYALPSGGAVFLEGAYNTREYDNTVAFFTPVLVQDSDGYKALIGARLDLTNVLRGEAAVGYLKQKYDDPRLPDASGLAARADLQWFLTGVTTIGFGGSREVGESGIVGSPGVLSSAVYARVDHELRRNIVLSGDVAFRDYEYKGFDRSDEIVQAGVGADYLANRNLRFGVAYRYDDRQSDGLFAGTDYSVNRFILKASARF